MNCWQQLDAALARHKRDLAAAKRWGRRFGWAWVKVFDAGNCRAFRSKKFSGGGLRASRALARRPDRLDVAAPASGLAQAGKGAVS